PEPDAPGSPRKAPTTGVDRIHVPGPGGPGAGLPGPLNATPRREAGPEAAGGSPRSPETPAEYRLTGHTSPPDRRWPGPSTRPGNARADGPDPDRACIPM